MPLALLLLLALCGTVSSTATQLTSILPEYARQVSTPRAVVETIDLQGRQLQDDNEDSDINYVEAGAQTTVSVSATAYDERHGDAHGCGDSGCLPSLAYDGVRDDGMSRWSCAKKIVPDGGQCEITFSFESPQDVMGMKVSFWKGDERTRTLKVKMNGKKLGEFESTARAITTSYNVQQNDVRTVTLESIGLDKNGWISLVEVNLMVAPAGSDDDSTDDSGLMCEGGIPGIQQRDVCCPVSCGSCAGAGCTQRDGGDSFTGREACCGGGVKSFGRVCSADVGAPCVIKEGMTPAPTPVPTVAPVIDQMCTAGVPGILVSDVCCPTSCGSCAGAGCTRRDGGDTFTGREACCGGGVRSLGRVCSAEVGAPCVVEDAFPTPAPATPAPATPAPGTPAPGTPAPGTPAPGTPAPTTPAPGTPPPTVPVNICLSPSDGSTRCELSGSGELDLAGCHIPEEDVDQIESCFEAVGKENIANLFLNDTSLKTLPAGVFEGLTEIQGLYLNENNLTNLPSGIFEGLTELKQLNLSFNSLTTLSPGTFEGLTELEWLSLYNNSLTTLTPGTFEDLTELQFLSLGDNNLTTLPAGIFEGLAALSELFLDGNGFTTLPAEIFEGLTGLTMLFLYSNEFTTLPVGIFEDLTALTKLGMKFNNLTTLPVGIFEGLTKLEYLGFGSNDLTTLPAGVFEGLTAVTELYLNGNDLTTLPAGVFEGLTGLTRLALAYNDLNTLPAGVFEGLPELQYLGLASNDLASLPAGVFEGLTALTELRLNKNDLTTLPAGIFEGLTALTRLFLNGNPLECLPASSASSIDADAGDECGCSIADGPENLCGEAQECTPGSEGYTCG
eukprot:g15705.t1